LVERARNAGRRRLFIVLQLQMTKKLQSTLKKLGVNSIPGIEEVNLIKDDGNVIHFNNPKVQASLTANTFAITGHAASKKLSQMIPSILSQLGLENLSNLRKFASTMCESGAGDDGNAEAKSVGALVEDDDVPDLVENFDEVSKSEVV